MSPVVNRYAVNIPGSSTPIFHPAGSTTVNGTSNALVVYFVRPDEAAVGTATAFAVDAAVAPLAGAVAVVCTAGVVGGEVAPMPDSIYLASSAARNWASRKGAIERL